MTKETDEKNRITDTINKSGAFLEIHVSNELQKREWDTLNEIPVQAAPFVGDPFTHQIHLPLNNGYTKENLVKSMFLCQNKNELEETAIDIIGINNGQENSFKLFVECKKLDPDYSDWIFFNVTRKRSINLITKNIQSKGFVILFRIPEYQGRGNEIFLEMNQFKHWDPFKMPISTSSLAISNKKLAKEVFQSKKSLVDNASRQIMKGVYGYILTDLQHQILSGEGYSHTNNVYVPIIVTTANLQICEVDPENIDPSTGFSISEPTYKKVDAIVYRCPTPKCIRFPHPDFNQLNMEHRRAISKWDVLIFSPKGFVDFLKDLKNVDLIS